MTHFDKDTSEDMRSLLERIRLNGWRVRFYWGDTKTGLDWGDKYDVCGTIGRSTGPCKIPILIKNRRSTGGGAILDSSIVRIRFANKKHGGDLYRHDNYHIEKELNG